MKLPKLGRIGTAIVLFVVLSAAGTAIGLQATGSSSPAASTSPAPTVTSKTKAATASLSSASTSAADACVNSFESTCGRFYWDPAPGSNAPLTVSVSPASATVGVGEPVSFTATGTDPDAPIACSDVYWGEGVNLGTAARLHRQYGRWVPPAKQQGQETKTFSHTYGKAGTYTIVVGFHSGDNCTENYNPYASNGSATLTVTVH